MQEHEHNGDDTDDPLSAPRGIGWALLVCIGCFWPAIWLICTWICG